MADTKDFDQRHYWMQRHELFRDDPRAVGNLGKSVDENVAGEKRVQVWVDGAAKVLQPYASVLDVGCGYGRAAKAFCDNGYAYVGIDVSPIAIGRARAAEPRGSFVVGCALEHELGQGFDLVAALYVFVHFVEDDRWASLIQKLSGALRSGGGLLFADDFPDERQQHVPHATHRPLAMHESAFRSCGLALDPRFRLDLAAALGANARLPPVHLARKL